MQRLCWIDVRPGSPYFRDEDGRDWTPVAYNDAITWPELAGLFRGKDLKSVEAHLIRLKAHGVNCIRVMLEYCHGEHRYLEKPLGRFVPNMVRLWDDFFALCEKVGIWLLVTPYDTFFMWIRWRHHPYNRRNGGPCASRRQWITCPDTRAAIKARLAFASDRWGGSPALFAWDLWNELHPAHGGDDPSHFDPFIRDLSTFVREREIRTHGRAHLQTVSIFGPELIAHPQTCEPIFRHPELDFATTHLYERGTIDDPRDTVAPALAVGNLMRHAVLETGGTRPVLDSEHGPIHRFKDKRHTLPAEFDDEYFRHIQWAHLASGGAGGGMRWPNRHPHVLTPGMREAQRGLSRFLPLIDWNAFRRRNISAELAVSDHQVSALGCADERQAVVWLIASTPLTSDGRVRRDPERQVRVTIPGLRDGPYRAVPFDTLAGRALAPQIVRSNQSAASIELTVAGDLAVAVQPL